MTEDEKPPTLKEKQITRHMAEHMLEKEQDPVVVEMLSPHAKTDLQVRKGFEDLDKHYIVLLLTTANKYQDTVEGLLRKYTAEGIGGIYVTINKPARTLLKNWSREKIPIDNIQVIDGSSHLTGVSAEPLNNVDYLESPADLTELIMAIEKKMRMLEKGSFLILDSVTTLLVYNEANSVEKFVHSLMGKIEETETKGVLLMLESNKFGEIIQTLSQFCDRIVEIV